MRITFKTLSGSDCERIAKEIKLDYYNNCLILDDDRANAIGISRVQDLVIREDSNV